MNYNNRKERTGAQTVYIVCALVFFCFSFFWLYNFQSDVLTVAQHTLSGGQTHYNRLIGAILISVILFVVYQGIYALVRPSRRFVALIYLPSFLLLAILSNLSPGTGALMLFGGWWWLAPLILLAWGGSVWLLKQLMPTGEDYSYPAGLFSRTMWINLVIMSCMMLFVAAMGNTNAVYHYRTHAEVALMNGDDDEALLVGRRSLETDENLTMLRLYALSRKGLIGDSLFSYPVVGRSSDMLPLKGSHSRLLVYPAEEMWDYFGGSHPTENMTVAAYLDSLAVDTAATNAYADYKLAGLLIDRKLDDFVRALPQYYSCAADSLPRHYREALQLYQSERDTVVVQDSLMQQRWQSFLENDSLYSDKRERRIKTYDNFRLTYWYYYRQ